MPLTYNQITAIAQNTIDKTLTDNVFKATPLLARLRAKAKKVSGGVAIQVPVISSSATSGGWYSDLEALNIARSDNMSSAVFQWKQAFESVRVSRLDLAKTSGDSAKLDLVASKIKIAEEALSERLSAGLFSDGTSQRFDGFAALIGAAAYAGIAPADLPEWVATVLGTTGALTLAKIQALDGACTNGKNAPTLFVARQNVYNEAYNLFTPFQRIESEEIGKLGFKSLMINGKPLIVDAAAASGEMLAINENFVDLRIHKDNDMRKEHHSSLETSDSSLTKIFFMGNLACSQRRANGKLSGITVV
jgi:hypothetical protein